MYRFTEMRRNQHQSTLQIQHLQSKMLGFPSPSPGVIPPTGWIKAIRSTLGMTLQQLGNRLQISKQGVSDFERREKEGSITLKSLQEIAHAMDMQLVYGFVAKDGSLDALIERRARELATQIVMRTAQSMELEDQANSQERIDQAIRERAVVIRRELPSMLWD